MTDPEKTVSAASWLADHVPDALRGVTLLGLQPWQWLGLLVAVPLAYGLGRVGTWVASRIGLRLASHTTALWDDDLIETTRTPSIWIFTVLAYRALSGFLALDEQAELVESRAVGTAATLAIAWWLVRVVAAVGGAIERRARENAGDTPAAQLEARGVTTQVHVMRRVLNVAIAILAVALVLTQFEVVRSVGVSLLASAGIAGVVLGLAAQKTLAGIFAGIHLTVTQPIRIGDVVIIEGEWGVIEEITLTFVVVKVWDERRLVVPITRFLDQPFQNWTMGSPELHGTIYFYVDWTFPVDRMREELTRIVTDNPLWDGRTQNVQVTDTKERTLEVRALVSAADSGKLWSLRTQVRERLVRWLQELDGGRYLPQTRAHVSSDLPRGAATPSG